MKDIRTLFENKERILEKDSGHKTVIYGAQLVSSPDSIEDLLVLNIGDFSYEYQVDGEDVKILPDDTIEFESLSSRYIIRDIGEEDDMSNLNPEDSGEGEEQ